MLLEIENEINNKTDIIKRSNYISNLLLYFFDWSTKNKKKKFIGYKRN